MLAAGVTDTSPPCLLIVPHDFLFPSFYGKICYGLHLYMVHLLSFYLLTWTTNYRTMDNWKAGRQGAVRGVWEQLLVTVSILQRCYALFLYYY